MTNEALLLVFGDAFARHSTDGHPENQSRLDATVAHLRQAGLWERCRVVPPRPARVEELALVHDRTYIDFIRSLAELGGGWLGLDTIVSPGTYEAATHAAGAGLVAAERILAGDARRAFCLVRPPGHHARPSRGMGFCIFNNIAVAARWLLTRGLGRLLIVDWDYHHGNGTEEVFYEDPRVFYLSLHLYPYYPWSGSGDSRGRGPGEGTTLNVPIARGTTSSQYLTLFTRALEEACSKSRPELILISAGFDGYRGDRLVGGSLDVEDFGRLTDLVVGQADAFAEGRVLSMLEGGYGEAGLPRCVAEHLRRLGRWETGQGADQAGH
jgi:acetoin utilization deacetylase AcuC-like enzyme